MKRLERVQLADGSTLHHCIPGTDRQHLASFLRPGEVPDFEGDVAWFEMKWHRKGVWMGWTIIRQVDPPA